MGYPLSFKYKLYNFRDTLSILSLDMFYIPFKLKLFGKKLEKKW
jgi:hypothetical protein